MFLLVNTKAKHQQCGHHKDQQEIAPCENLSPVTSPLGQEDRKSTRLNSSHANISYAVFCLKKKKPPWRTARDECRKKMAYSHAMAYQSARTKDAIQPFVTPRLAVRVLGK